MQRAGPRFRAPQRAQAEAVCSSRGAGKARHRSLIEQLLAGSVTYVIFVQHCRGDENSSYCLNSVVNIACVTAADNKTTE